MNLREGSRRLAFACVCFAVPLVFGCDTHSRSAKHTGEAQPLFTPQAATLAQQKMCDEQAAKKFHEERYSDFEKKDELPLTSYTSHYDPAVNVCYVRVHSVHITPPIVSDRVYDAFGGRVYANFVWIGTRDKKFWEVPPTECDFNIPGKPEEKCATDTQFDDLTEKYFGVTK